MLYTDFGTACCYYNAKQSMRLTEHCTFIIMICVMLCDMMVLTCNVLHVDLFGTTTKNIK